MTVPYTIIVDSATVTSANAVLLDVQETVPAADLPYTWTGLARVGLNRLHYRIGTADYPFVAADFTPTVDGDASVDIDVEDDDDVRATEIATALSVTAAHVMGAAVCTGAAAMLGVDARILGPFNA